MTPIARTESVAYLVGSRGVSKRPLQPYAPLLCDFLGDLSSELRSNPEAASYPDIMAFAFWCRKANLAKLKGDFEDGKLRVGLGLALHITPSNVPINFAFSFAFGLLSGNANLVRVPSKPFPQVELFCAAVKRLFKEAKYGEIKAMTAFLRYEQDDQVTAALSEDCDARVLWGGDAAIRDIRRIPLPERGIEITFPDRYSFCILGASSIIALDEDGLKRLAADFYNDAYLMDQNACSSPHLVLWHGDIPDKAAAKEKFWAAVSGVVADKYQLDPVSAVDKYTLLCRDALELDGVKYFKRHDNHVYRIGLKGLAKDMDTLRGRYGYFYECDAGEELGLADIVNHKYQTLTYFGVDKAWLGELVVKNRLSGIDRIVPVGKALEMGVIWDGYDVVKSLSRIIDVM